MIDGIPVTGPRLFLPKGHVGTNLVEAGFLMLMLMFIVDEDPFEGIIRISIPFSPCIEYLPTKLGNLCGKYS